MVKARKYVVKNYFQGMPKRDDYEIVEEELPPLKDGQILIKSEWISVDPYLRLYNGRKQIPYDQFGHQVGEILQSKDPKFPVGAKVASHKGWCDYAILDTAPPQDPQERVYLLPDMKGLSNSLAVGAVGMPGVTAYFGFLEICQPKAGETVVVTTAAGAVGSIVGQIAKIKGCRVIGFTGSDEKVKWLETDLGFDKALNYKTANVAQALKEAAPNGVDCFFDNVGDEISSIILSQMNLFGRISICGTISSYNEDPERKSKTTSVQPMMLGKQLRMEGFWVWRFINRWDEAIAQMVDWIKEGKLRAKEHVTEGFDNLFDALVGMMKGENFGKAVVKV